MAKLFVQSGVSFESWKREECCGFLTQLDLIPKKTNKNLTNIPFPLLFDNSYLRDRVNGNRVVVQSLIVTHCVQTWKWETAVSKNCTVKQCIFLLSHNENIEIFWTEDHLHKWFVVYLNMETLQVFGVTGNCMSAQPRPSTAHPQRAHFSCGIKQK